MLPFEKAQAFSYSSRNDLLKFVKRRRYFVAGGALFVFIFLLLIRSWGSDSSRPIDISTTTSDRTWQYPRDAKRYTLTDGECDAAFPGLYADVDRAVRDRNGRKITLEEIDSIPRKNGYVRGMIYDQQLYILSTEGKIYSRTFATLLALHRAILTSPGPLPNIEFTFSADDWLPPTAQWAYARKSSDKQTWLMPDFGFYSWPETKVGSYGEVQSKAMEMEDTATNPSGQAWSWDVKNPKILWRGATMGLALRESFIRITGGKPWADVMSLDWHDKASTDADLKSMDEHCQYKFLAHTEGNSYSGRLKYLQNCRSVIVAHTMDWYQHFTHLMKSTSGPQQNYVEVKRDFSDLESSINELLKNDEKAKLIANNNVKVFRERYLTPSAEACYWRKLIRGWARVSFEPELWGPDKDGAIARRGVPIESYILERRMEWDPY